MNDLVLVDTNLLLLYIVGLANRDYIGVHRRLSGYDGTDFELPVQTISIFSDIVLLPHVLAEVSNLARQTPNPMMRSRIQEKLKELVEATAEIPISSRDGVRRDEFDDYGVTDAVILQLCSLNHSEVSFWLLTADHRLAVQAEILGYDVMNFAHLRESPLS
jgi:hypothetical protein